MSNPWIEAMRLRTLPVSVAGVIAGLACALFSGSCRLLPAICCLLFAIGAQIASNFANEYFDFRNGLDRKGREGFRRGVTEGDIKPQAMLRATFLTLALAAIPGLALITWGGWWLIAIGILVAIFALAYSAGPYQLSHHGLGDLAVVIFFGLVPVGFTAWLSAGTTAILPMALTVGTGVGLLAANVLIVNNYRDADDDRAVGKHTTVVLFGRKFMGRVYLTAGIIGVLLTLVPAVMMCFDGHQLLLAPILALPALFKAHHNLITQKGAALNAVLRQTALVLLWTSLLLLAEALVIYFC